MRKKRGFHRFFTVFSKLLGFSTSMESAFSGNVCNFHPVKGRQFFECLLKLLLNENALEYLLIEPFRKNKGKKGSFPRKRQTVFDLFLKACGLVRTQFSLNETNWLSPLRTAVPFWGQITYNLTGLSPKRDCGSKRFKPSASAVRYGPGSDVRVAIACCIHG